MKPLGSGSGTNAGGRPPRKIEFTLPKFLTVQIQSTAEDVEVTTREEADRKTQIRLSKWMNAITAIGYFISFCALLALVKSFRLSSEATRAAVKQSETSQAEYLSSQRPWISIRATTTRLYMLPNGAAQIDPLEIEAVNVGHSVALHVVIFPRLVTTETITGRECEIAEPYMKYFSRKGNGIAIFPAEGAKEHFPGFMAPDEVQKSAEKSVLPSQITFKLVVCANYLSSVDNGLHTTRAVFGIQSTLGTPDNFPLRSGLHNILIGLDFNGTEAN